MLKDNTRIHYKEMCCNRIHVVLIYTEVNRTFEQEDMKMAQQESKKSGGGKLSRSETVTVRLDPKLRYLAELAARKQRRTLSSFIEWAIEDALGRVYLDDHGTSVTEVAYTLWDVDDSDRFAKLAIRFPELLTHEEQVLWKLVRENGHLWKGKHDGNGDWVWKVVEDGLVMERLREHWLKFNAVANGEAEPSTLPKWKKTKTSGFEDFEDDIPF